MSEFISNPIIPTHTISSLQNSNTFDNDTISIKFPVVSSQLAPVPVGMSFSDSNPNITPMMALTNQSYALLPNEIAKQQIIVNTVNGNENKNENENENVNINRNENSNDDNNDINNNILNFKCFILVLLICCLLISFI